MHKEAAITAWTIFVDAKPLAAEQLKTLDEQYEAIKLKAAALVAKRFPELTAKQMQDSVVTYLYGLQHYNTLH